MNCQQAREILPELLDPRASAGAHPDVRVHLAGCPDCQREFAALSHLGAALDAAPAQQPSPNLRRNFRAMLDEEKRSDPSPAHDSFRNPRASRRNSWGWVLLPLAGCALVLVGFLFGQRTAPAPAPKAPPNESTTDQELAAMRLKLDEQQAQLNRMTRLVGYSILQQQKSPANERLRQVLTAGSQDQPADSVLDDLILALTLDPNTNVRLGAIEALYPHRESELVHAAVLTALSREQNPLVQLELIDFIAAERVHGATSALERIATDKSSDAQIRDAARLALARM